jgi:hypothetical protein
LGVFFFFCPLELASLRGEKKEEREREREREKGKKGFGAPNGGGEREKTGCDICSRCSLVCTVGFAAQTLSILFIFGSVLPGQKETEGEREREGGAEGGERVVDCGEEKGK